MEYSTISNTIYYMTFKIFFTLTVFDILLIHIKECVCDESSFSFSGMNSEDGDDIQFPIPLAESNQSSASHYEISMSEVVTKKRGRGRPKGELRTTVETTTMHPRFIVMPSVIVFKADEVFWPFRVETEIIGPFGLRQITSEATSKPGLIIGDWGGRELIDINGTLMKVYEHAEIVLRTFHKKGIKLGVMEQTKLGGKVIHLIKLFELDVFEFWHINEDSEIDHMKRIRRKADVNFRDIVYVGTNETTMEEMKNLGVIVFKLKLGEGLQLRHIGEIVHEFATRPHINTTESHNQIKLFPQEQPNSTLKTNKQTVEEDYSADIDQFVFVKG